MSWFIPRNVSLFSQQTKVCTWLMQVVLHCKLEVFKLHVLHCIENSGFVLAVSTIVAVLSFARLSRYANMLVIILL